MGKVDDLVFKAVMVPLHDMNLNERTVQFGNIPGDDIGFKKRQKG